MLSDIHHKQTQLESDKSHWEDTRTKVDKLYAPESQIVDLDIGGTHKVSTTLSTLTSVSDSALAAMFSGRHKLTVHKDRVFVDREGESFVNMLNYLSNLI